MATREIVYYDCDTCGKEDVVTHTFSIDGQEYEIDACAKCWAPFEKAAEKLTASARKVKQPPRQRRRRVAAAS